MLSFDRPNLLPEKGEAYFFPDFLSLSEANAFFHLLREEITWEQKPIKMFGKTVMQPRLTAWYGDPGKGYRYSGIILHPLPWTATLLKIKDLASQAAGVEFNGALLNLYRDGKDSMGWHRDNEKELGPRPVIGSVSLGATRQFQLRKYEDGSGLISLNLTTGSLLLMQGETQHYWEHRVAKVPGTIDPRINITFRVL